MTLTNHENDYEAYEDKDESFDPSRFSDEDFDDGEELPCDEYLAELCNIQFKPDPKAQPVPPEGRQEVIDFNTSKDST